MRLQVTVVSACAVVAALPFFACIPGLGQNSCSPPYSRLPLTLSHMVKEPPLSSVFTCAVTVWTLATVEWLRQEEQPLRWLVLVFGLAFASVPTDYAVAQWVTHSVLLVCVVLAHAAATKGACEKSPEGVRLRARVHRAAAFAAAIAGTVLLAVGRETDALPDLIRAYSVAALEVVASIHMVAFQVDIMQGCR